MARQTRRTTDFKIKGRSIDGRKPDIVVQTSDGAIAGPMKTIRTKAQADAAVAKLLGRAARRA
jgi:hypothetical protein